jgi:2-iminobutanoate/2-iminopropanoate deaminase
MTKTVIRTNGAPSPAGPYNQGIAANGMVYTAGFGPQHPVTGVVPATVGDQTRQVLRNISAVLEAHGASLGGVVKVTAHLQNLKEDFAEYNDAYKEFFAEPYPVRTTVGSQLFDILVEIDVVVALPSGT